MPDFRAYEGQRGVMISGQRILFMGNSAVVDAVRASAFDAAPPLEPLPPFSRHYLRLSSGRMVGRPWPDVPFSRDESSYVKSSKGQVD